MSGASSVKYSHAGCSVPARRQFQTENAMRHYLCLLVQAGNWPLRRVTAIINPAILRLSSDQVDEFGFVKHRSGFIR